MSKHQREGEAPTVSNTQGILRGTVYQIPACPWAAPLMAEVRGSWGACAVLHTYTVMTPDQQGSHWTLREPEGSPPTSRHLCDPGLCDLWLFLSLPHYSTGSSMPPFHLHPWPRLGHIRQGCRQWQQRVAPGLRPGQLHISAFWKIGFFSWKRPPGPGPEEAPEMPGVLKRAWWSWRTS